MIARFRHHPKGLTLVELLICVTIVGVLAAIAYPIIQSGIRSSHKAGCLTNLRQIGLGLEAYLQENNQVMPTLEAGRSSRSDEDVPVLETVLAEYLENPEVFHCPADSDEFQQSGSSYLWNVTQNGLRRSQLSFFGTEDVSRIPLVIDKEAWHSGSDGGTQFLYANMTASQRVTFAASP